MALTTTVERTVNAAVPDSPAALFGSFAGAAVVGQAAAAFPTVAFTPAAGVVWDSGRVDTRTVEYVEGMGLVVGNVDPRVRKASKLAASSRPSDGELLAGGLVGRGLATREGVVYRIEVSPGSIAVRRRDYARAERTAQRQLEAAALEARLRVTTGMVEDALSVHKRRVRSWSAKSRANMVRRLATLDYAPLIEQGTPAMVTLTYPGDWLTVAPSAAVCAEHVRKLQLRFRRAWGRPMIGVWKREFQRRGAPHYHLLMVPPTGRVNGLDFKAWLSETWASIVGHPDPIERAQHRAAGTNVDLREGARYADPRRVGVYFSKHGSYSAKDYQNEAPAEWLADETAGIGRFWGVWGLRPAVGVVEVDEVVATAVRRTARRWQAATALRERGTGKPATVKRTVWRKVQTIDRETGELGWKWRKRKVSTRIRPHLSGRGGFLCVNDGPGLALDLARYAEQLPGLVVGAAAAGQGSAGGG